MIEKLVGGGYASDMESAERRVTDYVNDVCKNILFNTAVFKKDQTGENGFVKFLLACGVK